MTKEGGEKTREEKKWSGRKSLSKLGGREVTVRVRSGSGSGRPLLSQCIAGKRLEPSGVRYTQPLRPATSSTSLLGHGPQTRHTKPETGQKGRGERRHRRLPHPNPPSAQDVREGNATHARTHARTHTHTHTHTITITHTPSHTDTYPSKHENWKKAAGAWGWGGGG